VSKFSLATCAFSTVAFMTSVLPATAQVSGPAAAELDEVVVTARRTEENLQSVPAAITAFSPETIRKQNIIAPQDLTGRVPSLDIGNSTTNRNSASYNIRGLGAGFGGGDPAVVPYFAEVPTITPGPGTFYDLQNVQVLKGPQGTLFGRNSTGGAILLEPQRPGSLFGGYAELNAGNYDYRRVQGGVDIPLIEDVLLTRVAFDINQREGFTRELDSNLKLDDRNYNSVRLGITYTPTAYIENYTIFDFSESDINGAGLVLTSVDPFGFGNFLTGGGLTAYLAQQNARGIRSTDHSLASYYERIETRSITNITTYDISDDYLVKLILGYRAFKQQSTNDVDGTPYVLVDYPVSPGYQTGTNAAPSQRQYSAELQLQGSSFEDRLTWITGVYTDDIEPWPSDTFDAISQALVVQPFITASQKKTKSTAVFASGTYDLSALLQGLSVTGGVRYTRDERQLDYANYLSPTIIPSPSSGACPAPPPAPTGVTCVHFEAEFEATTWNVGVNWQATPGTLLYVASRRGYKGGGFNANSISDDTRTFEPEFVTDVELGAKADFNLGGSALRLNAAIYQTKFEDIQFANTQTDVNGGLRSFIQNGPKATIKGLELEGTLATPFGLTINAFYSRFDGEYDELFQNTSVPTPDPNDSPLAMMLVTIDLSGAKFLGAKNRAGTTVGYRHDFGNVGVMDLTATYNWTGDQSFDQPLSTRRDPTSKQKAYGVLNLRAALDNVGGHPVELSAFVNNVAEEEYKTYYLGLYDSFGLSSTMWSEPRMYGVGLRYRFGAAAD
jgi:iron complex outermembrane receptor protein